MSFGGSVSAMIASLKANKRTRVSTFDKIKDLKKCTKSELHFKNKATPKEIAEIREKMQKENNIIFFRKVLVIIILLAVILYAIGFVKN
ncbi:hypothetical protein [Polaribacter cellanae]|uniref:Uncharacterized protein n=1 Tax=Polaribacter cellanae TaxID=2818493 RepID=A0A975CSF8_9FLAO|nr:hypothetical protein [Polaribacter cellanae]QTE24084.1 hypothetical protein J3359_07425 [Polaribacter cellanae]